MLIRFYKCRKDLFIGVKANIQDPGSEFWSEMNLKPIGSRWDEYLEYTTGKQSPDQYRIIPTRALIYVETKGFTYARLLRHNYTAKIEPSPKLPGLDGFVVMKLSNNITESILQEIQNQPDEKWLQEGVRGDKLVLQIKMVKIVPLRSNCDDVTGELYFYSPVQIRVLIRK